jgi:hypothetical protein
MISAHTTALHKHPQALLSHVATACKEPAACFCCASHLEVCLVLDQLLCTAVQQADVGVSTLHQLTCRQRRIREACKTRSSQVGTKYNDQGVEVEVIYTGVVVAMVGCCTRQTACLDRLCKLQLAVLSDYYDALAGTECVTLTLHLQHQAQHTVSSRVLRAEVDGEVVHLKHSTAQHGTSALL